MWPLRVSLRGVWTPERVALLYLLRLLRLSKIAVIMDIDKFISVVRSYYRQKLQKVVLPPGPGEKRTTIFNSNDHTIDNNHIMPQIMLIKIF